MNKQEITSSLSLDRFFQSKRILAMILSSSVFLIALIWSHNLSAEDLPKNLNEDAAVQKQAAEFIQNLSTKALTTLKQKDTPLVEMENHFRNILIEGFDVDYIGKISLGRHKREASTQQLNRYYNLFPEYLVKVYTTRLTKLDTREVNVDTVLPKGKYDMYVRTKITAGEQKTYDVDWRVRPDEKASSYKIVDVKIEGVSMARTQRDDFSAKIASSGMEGLVQFMQSIVDGTVAIPEDTEKTVPKDDPEEKTTK